MPLFEGNWEMAVGISVAAGLCTLIGGFILFVPSNWRTKHYQTILAVSLAFASGVMLYVSFAEIFFKSLQAAAMGLNKGLTCSAGFDGAAGEEISEETAFGYTFPPHWLVSLLSNGLLFAGMLVAIFLDWLVHFLAPELEELSPEANLNGSARDPAEEPHEMNSVVASEPLVETSSASDRSPSPRRAEPYPDYPAWSGAATPPYPLPPPPPPPATPMPPQDAREPSNAEDADRTFDDTVAKSEDSSAEVDLKLEAVSRSRLNNLGMLSVLAIGLHNLPEGLATFTATIEEPANALPLVIGIALHNIPEGICVAIPIYYATGSRVKALFWTFVSGIMEPIGGILGYMALKTVIGEVAYAIIFGLVSGMMIHIVTHEYLPTCHALKVRKSLIVGCSMAGMIVMWLSIFVLLMT